MSDSRATNRPFGGSLLDKSSAQPGNVDMSIFAPKAPPNREGYTSSDYMDRNRREDPGPIKDDASEATITLSGCKFLTAPDQLGIEKQFEAECKVTWSGENPPEILTVYFAVKMTWDRDGEPQEEDGGEEFSGEMKASVKEQTVQIKAKLPRPPSFPPPATKINYKLLANHTGTDSTSESESIDLVLKEDVYFVEIADNHFIDDGFFPCLDAKGSLIDRICACFQHTKESPTDQLVAFGHADCSQDQPSNYEISKYRAQACIALISGDGKVWENLARKRLKAEEIQTALKSLTTAFGWPCDPGEIDGKLGPKTEHAIEAFQAACNSRYKLGLTVDGIAGPKIWKAMHRVLFGLIAIELDVSDPNSASMPVLSAPEIEWQDGNGGYGCGSSFPVDKLGIDGLTSATNNRVDLLFGFGWNFLRPIPDDSRTLTIDECSIYDGNGIEWIGIPVENKTPIQSSKYTEIAIFDKHFDDDHFLPNLASDEFLETLAGIADFHQQNGKCPLEIHPETQTVQQDSYKKRLQVAECIVHSDENVWSDLVNQATIFDVQIFLKYFASKNWSCDPGEVDGIDGPETQSAVKVFQESCNNAWKLDLAIDGICGPKTWLGVLRTLFEMVSPMKDEQTQQSEQQTSLSN